MKCKALTNQIVITDVAGTRAGLIKPCCSFHADSNNAIKEEVRQNLSIFNVGIESARDELAKIDLDTKPSSCNRCFNEERNGVTSLRQYHNNAFSGNGKLESLELSMDGVCNMSCITCDTKHSSTWLKKDNLEEYRQIDKSRFNPNPSHALYTKNLKKELADIDLSNLKFLRLGGGEPFFSKNSTDFFQNIKNKEDIKLFFNTNGSIYPSKKIIECLKQYKKVQIDLSIDAFGKLGEFIRPGVSWSIIESNLEKFQELSLRYPQIETAIHSTITSLNINTWDQLMTYCTERNMRFTYTMAHSPNYLSLIMIPLRFRKMFFYSQRWTNDSKYKAMCYYPEIPIGTHRSKLYRQMIRFIDLTGNDFGIKLEEANEEIYDIIQSMDVTYW